jgi:hypothetical protein
MWELGSPNFHSAHWLVIFKKQACQFRLDCPQVCPVPLKPSDTIYKRVADSACLEGWIGRGDQDNVPSCWNDPDNVHVYLYVDQG